MSNRFNGVGKWSSHRKPQNVIMYISLLNLSLQYNIHSKWCISQYITEKIYWYIKQKSQT